MEIVCSHFPFQEKLWGPPGLGCAPRPPCAAVDLVLAPHRFSSVQLLGDLLFHISGVTGKMTTETASEDDNFGTAQSNKVCAWVQLEFLLGPVPRSFAHRVFFPWLQAIITALGVDRRNRVLAGLYMGRSDTQLVVRQASLHVWKIVVSNTPRTLREILPTLFGLLLGFLASTCADKRTVNFLGLILSQQFLMPPLRV